MEDHCSENDKTLEMITAEHAVLIPTLPSVKSIMAYVEAVAVVIGSCHIHSVYEDHDNIKIYLNDKRFVDILVNNGVSILGRRMNVDYAIPRADKVLLSNVDPVVPDPVIMKLLGFYGNPVSAIIHEKIATNAEYSHIECGKRKVYMKIFDDKKVPSKINFTYQDVCYQIDVLVERCENGIYETAYTIADRSEDENEVESNLSVKPNVSELPTSSKRQPSAKQLAYRNRGRNKESKDSAGFAARKIQRRARKQLFTSKKDRQVSSNQLAIQRRGKAKRMAVKKYLASISKKDSKKGPRGSFNNQKRRKGAAFNTSVPEIDLEPEKEYLNDGDLNTDANGVVDSSSVASTNDLDVRSVSQYPLNDEELEQFIFKTRFHREPVQVALQFLGDNKTQEGLDALKSQLLAYLNICKDPALRLRIKRLIMSLKNAKVDEGME